MSPRRGEPGSGLREFAFLLVLSLLLAACDDEEPVSPPDAVALLRRMLKAEDEVSYEAAKRITLYRQKGDPFVLETWVTHYAGGPTVVKKKGPKPRRWVETGARFYWLGKTELLLRNHVVRRTGEAEVLGRPVVVLHLRSRYEGRPSMRFEVDRETGLLLVAEVTDWQGNAAVRSDFSAITIGPELPPPPELPEESARVRGAKLEPIDEGQVAGLPFVVLDPGELPKGFVRTARCRSAGNRPMLKTVYSDGYSWIEVREWRARPDAKATSVAEKCTRGARTRLCFVVDGTEIVLVGRLDPEELLKMMESFAPVPSR